MGKTTIILAGDDNDFCRSVDRMIWYPGGANRPCYLGYYLYEFLDIHRNNHKDRQVEAATKSYTNGHAGRYGHPYLRQSSLGLPWK